jgi:type IV pilus assembly protein PilQ
MTLWGAGTGATQAADAPGPPRELRDVKVEQRAAAVAVTVVTSGQPKYETTLLDSPVRLVIDINGTFASPRSRWTGVPEPLKEVRGSQFKPGTARLVMELNRKAGYRIEEGPQGLTVVIDAPAGPATAEASPAVPKRLAAALPDLPRMPEAAKLSDAPRTPIALKATEPTATERKPAVAVPAPLTTAPGVVAVRPAALVPVLVAQAATTPAPAAPSAPAPPAPNGSKLITLEFKDADVVNLLRILSAESGRNIVAGDDVKGKLSVSLRNVTWEQALDTILEVKGLQKIDRGGTIRIISNDQVVKDRLMQAAAEDAKRKAEIDNRIKAAEAQLKEADVMRVKERSEMAANEASERGPLKEEVIRLSYADPGEIAITLQDMFSLPSGGKIDLCRKIEQDEKTGTKVTFSTSGGATSGPIAEPPFSQLFGPPRLPDQPGPPPVSVSQGVLARGLGIRAYCPTNSLFLRLHAADLERVKKIVRESFDVPVPQVKIEARMEILDRTALEAIGIQWGGAGATNVGRATVVGQGFQSPLQNPGLGTGVTNVSPPNSNLDLSSLLPVFPGTGLPFAGNLVNLPISALPNAAGVIPAGGIAFGIIGTNWNINLALQALATLGKTRTLARPEVVTIENSLAVISLGEEIPYATVSSAGTQIQFKEALLKLATIPTVIRPRVDGNDATKIKLIVTVENNSRGDTVNLGASGSPPAINKRRADTIVLLNEGERLVIGGVTQSVNQTTIRKVPYLGDIPFLGWAFKQREIFEQGRELVVFLTPSVLKGTSQAISQK